MPEEHIAQIVEGNFFIFPLHYSIIDFIDPIYNKLINCVNPIVMLYLCVTCFGSRMNKQI